jgi:hypothetical protein
MPIDDALKTLKEVPEYLLKETLNTPLKFPETIEDLQEMYKNRFSIFEDPSLDWLNIIVLGIHKDIDNNNRYKLEYTFEIGSKKPIKNVTRECTLYCTDGRIWQAVEKDPKRGFNGHKVRGKYLEEYRMDDKIRLGMWFNKTEKHILKEIPELEEFVKNYANR